MQCPTNAGAALARRTGSALRAILLLALRRRCGGVVRGLRRPGQFIEPRFKRGNTCILCRDPLVRGGELCQQRKDQRVLLGMIEPGEIGRLEHPAFRIDSGVTVSSRI